MNKRIKITGISFTIFLTLLLQISYAFAWMETETINDYSDDLRIFDEDFYDKFEIDMNDNPQKDLNKMSDGFGDNFYGEYATELTDFKNEKYAYVDVVQITKEVVSEELVIRVRLRGSLKDVDYWMMFVWSENDMLLIFTAFDEVYRMYDFENDDTYHGKFYDTDSENVLRFSHIDEEAWKNEDIKFISIGKGAGDDIVVDLLPEPTNWNLIYWITGLMLTFVVMFGLIVYYKNKN